MFSKSCGYFTIILKSIFLNIQNNQNLLQNNSTERAQFTSGEGGNSNVYTPPISTFGFPSWLSIRFGLEFKKTV